MIDADGTYLGKYRKTHIPHVKGFWEKFYFRPGNLGYPVFDTAVGKVGVYICYDRHFPEGARALGLNGAELVFIPSATSRGLSEYLWRVEQVSHALANGYFVGTINRVGIEPLGDDDFYGQSYFVRPARPVRRRRGRCAQGGAAGARPGHGPDHRGAPALAVLPRPPPGRLRGPGAPLMPEMDFGFTLKPENDRQADRRADEAGRGQRLHLRLALRQPRALARAVRAADPHGAGHRAHAPRHLRHQPRHPRAVRDRLGAGGARRAERGADGPGHRPRRQRAPGARQAADHA